MLKKGIEGSKLLKLFVFLYSFSLLILLHVTPVYTDSDVKDNEIKMFRDHVEHVKNKYPELDEKLIEIEEKLKTGTPVKDCCKDCHLKSQK